MCFKLPYDSFKSCCWKLLTFAVYIIWGVNNLTKFKSCNCLKQLHLNSMKKMTRFIEKTQLKLF